MTIRLTKADSRRKGKKESGRHTENRVCDKFQRRVEIPAN